MNWVDCGVNLLSPQFQQPESVLLQGLPAVNRFVLIACQLDEARELYTLAQKNQGCISTAGIHPHYADQAPADFIAHLRDLVEFDRDQHLVSERKIRALGECGLDYFRNFSSPQKQRQVFAQQVALAVELQLPLYLHERDAQIDQLAILSEHKGTLPPLFVHCFTQGRDALAAYQELDAYFGITGWVCDERRGTDLVAAVPFMSAERLLLETDAPYLLPRTLKPVPKQRLNQPCWLPHIAAQVADLRQQELADLAQQTTANALRLFGQWPVLSQEQVALETLETKHA